MSDAPRSEPRNVSLSIGGRNHVISVGADEEAHLRMLAAMIDDRVSRLGMGQGQTEARMLLVTALMLADELHTLQTARVPDPAPVAAPAPAPAVAAEPVADAIAPKVLERVTALTERVEKLAARLEQSGLEDSPPTS